MESGGTTSRAQNGGATIDGIMTGGEAMIDGTTTGGEEAMIDGMTGGDMMTNGEEVIGKTNHGTVTHINRGGGKARILIFEINQFLKHIILKINLFFNINIM